MRSKLAFDGCSLQRAAKYAGMARKADAPLCLVAAQTGARGQVSIRSTQTAASRINEAARALGLALATR